MSQPPRTGPVSREQLRLWTYSQVYPGDTAYVIRSALRFHAALDRAALAAAVSRLIDEYPVLAWTFHRSGDLVERRMGSPGGAGHFVWTHAVSERDAERLLSTIESDTADLSTGPLFRVVAVSFGPQDAVVCLLAHHIVVDAWSTEMLWRDLATFYNGAEFRPTEKVSYDVYTRQQPASVPAHPGTSGTDHRDIDVVRRDHQVPPPAGSATRHLTRELPDAMAGRVDAVAARHGVTPFTVLLTAFGIAIRRYDPRVGRLAVVTHVSTRLREELAGTVGFFVRTVPIVLDFGTHSAAAELLGDVCGQLLATLDSDAPDLDGWKTAQGLAGLLDRNPAGEICFQQLTHDPQRVCLRGAEGSDFSFSGSRTDFRLSVTCARTRRAAGASIAAHIAYDPDVYTEGTIETIYAKFVAIAGELASADEASVSRLGAGVSRRAAVAGGDRPLRRGQPVWDRLESRAGTDRVAVSCEDGRALTLTELLSRASGIAGRVQALAAPGQRVAVLAEDRLNGILATLACWRAGCPAVHLDPADAGMGSRDLNELDVRVVLTDRSASPPSIAGRPCLPIELRDDQETPPRTVAPPVIAYLIATSGTTDRSVWVERPMAAVESFLADASVQLDPDWCVIQNPPLTYEPGLRDSLLALYGGAELFLGEGIDSDPVGTLARAIEVGHGNAIVSVVPSILHVALVRLRNRYFTTKLHMVRCVGEPVPRTTALLCREVLGTDLVVDYGTSEAAMVSLSSPVRPADVKTDIMPLGTPVPPSQVMIVDPDGQPVDRAMLGEIVIAGPHVAARYLGTGARDGLLRDRDGRACHRTGDLGYLDDAGVVHWVGRVGSTVKVRGRMVDLQLVRRTMESYPGIAEAYAYIAGEGIDARLMAVFCVASGAANVDEESMRVYLYQRLGARYAPSRVIQLPSLPRAKSGKIRPADLAADGDLTQGAADPPRTGTESVVAGCFAQVLGCRPPARLADFFALGGHSLDAIRLADLLSARAGTNVRARAIFENPTVAALSSQLDRLRAWR